MDEQRRRLERAAAAGDREAALRLQVLQRRLGERCARCRVGLPPELVGVETLCPGCLANQCDDCESPRIVVVDPGPGTSWLRCGTCDPVGACPDCGCPRNFDAFGWPVCHRCAPWTFPDPPAPGLDDGEGEGPGPHAPWGGDGLDHAPGL